MKSLLRSLFIGDDNDNEKLLMNNYQLFNGSALGFDVPEYNAIWGFIQDFVRTHSHVPNILTIRSHFEHSKEDTVLDQLKALEGLKARTKGDFQGVLEDKADDRRQRLWSEALKEASIITSTGMEVSEGRDKKILIGPVQSARYLMEKAHDVVAPTIGGRLSGEVTKDGVATREEYERVEADPLAGIGQFTFLKQMDDALGGAKRHELWIHAAFTGALKSTFMLNWAYNQAVIYQHNILIFSLEMPYSQCRRILYAIHSMHPKFREVRVQLGLQQDPEADVGLSYGDIRDGKLDDFHPNAKHFYFDFVIPDFGGKDVTGHPYMGCDYGKIHIEVADPDKDDFTMHDLRSMAEVIYSKEPFSMIAVDHVGLMSPRRHRQSTTENLNEVIRDMKKLALGFNRGMGIAVLGLFQISREGYKSALKAKEKTGKAGYNLTHLSYANECISAESLVFSDKGVLPVTAIQQGYRVWSRSGWKVVKEKFDQGVRRLWRVVTDRGSFLDATADHRVRTLANESLCWNTVGLLHAEDWVVSCSDDYPWSKEGDFLPDLVVGKYEHTGNHDGVLLSTPPVVTAEVAYLLGAWDGDGNTGGAGVRFTGNRKEVRVRDRILDAFESVFGVPMTLIQSPSRPGSFDLQNTRCVFRQWLDQVSGPRGSHVPAAIWGSSRPLVLAYLRGLFDTDGWINNQNVIGIKMKSEDFLRQIQHMMTMLGYDTNLSVSRCRLKATGKTYAGWTLRLRGRASAMRFADEISFTEPWKAERLAAIVNGDARVTDKRVYPVGRMFAGLAADYTPYSLITQGTLRKSHYNSVLKARKNGKVAHGAIEYLLTYLEGIHVVDERVDFLRHILTLQVMQVVSVKDTGRDEHVYDIEVGGDHEYQTGPLLSHNCERSADVVTSTWIDDEMKNQSRVQFDCMKSRDQKPFDPFIARVEWPCRRILSCFDVALTPEENAKMGAEVDAAGKELDED